MTARGLFITGTNTEVGKTYITALIAKQLVFEGRNVGVYKPAASGCNFDEGDDSYVLWDAAGRPADLDLVCPQRFAPPLAPHLAARAEDKEVDAKIPGIYDVTGAETCSVATNSPNFASMGSDSA